MCSSSVLAFLIRNLNMIPYTIMASDDEFDALKAPLVNTLVDKSVDALPAEPSHYSYESVWLSIEQIADRPFPPRDAQSGQVKRLFASMRAPRCD